MTPDKARELELEGLPCRREGRRAAAPHTLGLDEKCRGGQARGVRRVRAAGGGDVLGVPWRQLLLEE